MNETALVPAAPAAVAAPPPVVVTRVEEIAQIRAWWIEEKRRELARALAVVTALRQLRPKTSLRLALAIDRAKLLKKVVRALEHGYLPLPRFDGWRLDLEMTELPAGAILALAEAERGQLFDEVRFVAGRQAVGGRGRRRIAARDPLLIGVVRSPSREVRVHGEVVDRIGGREEHFLIAWWRPEDERDEVMF